MHFRSVLPALALSVAIGSAADRPVSDAPALSPQEFHVRMAQQPGVLIDVRTPDEYVGGHLTGAMLVDFLAPGFSERFSKLPKDRVYYVYCRSGNRSSKAVAQLRAAGFKKVYEMGGGIKGWLLAGLPLCEPVVP